MAGKQAKKTRAAKKAPRKTTRRLAAGKKAGKKSAGKSAAKKQRAGKSAATKPAGKSARKKSTKASATRTAGKKSAKKSARSAPPAKVELVLQGPKPTISRAKPSAIPRGKTARSRLARKRALAGKALPSRKIALRTSLARRPPETARKRVEPASQPFAASALAYREATRHDWPVIRRILIEAFGRADESELVETLRASRDLVGEYVAEHAGRTVAYIGFCTLAAHIDGKPFRAAGLAPLAVAGEVEGHGVGTRLTVFGLENIRGLGHDAVFVLGDTNFYGRFGFSSRRAERFESPWPGPHYQALEFEPGALRGSSGATHWPRAFSVP